MTDRANLPSCSGLVLNMPAAEYHAVDAVSASKLKKFHLVTDAHAKVALAEPFEPTPETIIGTLGHLSILEPLAPWPMLAVQPETYGPERKKWTYAAGECKAWREAQKAAGRITVKEEDLHRLHGITDAIRGQQSPGAEYAREILTHGQSEVSLFIEPSPRTLCLPLKCRMDFVPAQPFLADVKLVRDVSDRGFIRDAYDRGYHVQAWWYLACWNLHHEPLGLEKRAGFKFVAIENQPPHCVRVFDCSPEFIARGGEDAQKYLARYKDCITTGVWRGYQEKEAALGLPGWVK